MAEWAGQARTRSSGRRRHWKLPDMISGVRHRFRDKLRSKSPELYVRDALDSDAGSSNQSSAYRFNGGGTLPRASSMMSTEYGFNPMEWGGETRGYPPPSTERVPRPPPHAPEKGGTDSFRGRSGTMEQQRPLSASKRHTQTPNRLTTSYEASDPRGECYDFSPPPTIYPHTVGRAASVSVLNQPDLLTSQPLHNQTLQPSLQRGKSVRFGENRISVFLQDSTQALEECVRLALSYAEESKARADYYSDSEAVTLTRRAQELNNSTTRSFYSDSEERPELREKHGDGETSPTQTAYRQKSFGQAVTSLDRLERLDKVRSEARNRKKRSAQINEIFSFIDKVLSGCDSGCSDEGCPLAREARRHSGITPHNHPRTSTNHGMERTQAPAYDGSSYSCSAGFTPRPPKKRTTSDRRTEEPSKGNSVGRGGGGFESDSDCDTSGSTSSTLVRGRGRPHRGRLRGGGEEEDRRRRRGDNKVLTKTATRTTEDVFAQIIICSELNKQSLGMPRYRHVHLKISQTVCNAIFLCKVS